jgi:hypothetical protein
MREHCVTLPKLDHGKAEAIVPQAKARRSQIEAEFDLNTGGAGKEDVFIGNSFG